ncbi:MAG: hypothetical protein ACREEX_11415, partial [Caulobacteraceae bacterium]
VSLSSLNSDLASLTDTDSNPASDAITVNATDSFGNSASPASIAVSVSSSSETFTFTKGVDHFTGGSGANTFIATSGALSAGDTAAGAGTSDVLELQGAGIFNLAAPSSLTGIPTVTAEEGQAASPGYPAQNQIVDLRAGMNGVTVNVAPDADFNAGNPKPATITIIGAANNDVINLASGNDTVVVGSALETVNGGSGADTIEVTSKTIGATIDGGSSGKSVLLVTGGGTMTMGASITDIAEVELANASKAYHFTANAIPGLIVDDLSSGADTITAGAAGQTLTGGAAGDETFTGAGTGTTTYKDPAATLNGDKVKNFIGTDQIDVSGLAFNSTGPDATSVSFKAINSTKGTLSIYEGTTLEAKVTIFHQFALGSFTAASDGAGGTLISDPPLELLQKPLVVPHVAGAAIA